MKKFERVAAKQTRSKILQPVNINTVNSPVIKGQSFIDDANLAKIRRRAVLKRYREKNREKIAAQVADYHKAHRETILARHRKYYADHRKVYCARQRARDRARQLRQCQKAWKESFIFHYGPIRLRRQSYARWIRELTEQFEAAA